MDKNPITSSKKDLNNVTSEAGPNQEGVNSTESQGEANTSESALLKLLDEFPMVLPMSFVQKFPGSNPIPVLGNVTSIYQPQSKAVNLTLPY